jgi:AcrR family transcriptional regulator
VTPARKTSRKKTGQRRRREQSADPGVRRRILEAAFRAFMDHGFSDASTLEIATRAKVSKRELYALFDSKLDMLVACIAERGAKMRLPPAQVPAAHDRESLARVLEAFGERLLAEVSHPTVISTFRLAIAEAPRAPEVARALDSRARQPNRAPLGEILAAASAAGLVDGDPAEMAEEFIALLWGDLFVELLLRLAEPPGQPELRRRARRAAASLLTLYGSAQK